MPLDERRSRSKALFQVLMAHDAKNWGERFLGALTHEQDDPMGVPWMRTDKLGTLGMDRESEEHPAVD
jgi:trehalose-6-phosphate synthase